MWKWIRLWSWRCRKKPVVKKVELNQDHTLSDLNRRLPSNGTIRYWALVELLTDKDIVTIDEVEEYVIRETHTMDQIRTQANNLEDAKED